MDDAEPPPPHPIRKLHGRAARQQHTLTRDDGRRANVPDSTFTSHLRRLGWDNRWRGVWVPEGAQLSAAQEAAALMASLGGAVAATGATALYVEGVLETRPSELHLLVPDHRALRAREGVCFHYTLTWDVLGFHHVNGVRVPRVARSIADHAAHVGVNAVVFAIADADRARLCTLDQIADEVAARTRFPGRGRLRTAHGLLTGELTHSRDERTARRHLREAGITVHRRPYPVRAGGRVIAEVDVAVPRACYGAEIDGPPHLLPGVAEADRKRDRRLARAGWTIDRFLWTEIQDNAAGFVAEVRDRLLQLEAG